MKLLLLALLSTAGPTAEALRVPERNGKPAVAAVVAVHPPKFEFMLHFLHKFEACEQALRAMDVKPIFSSEDDRDDFARQFCSGQPEGCNRSLPYQPLISDSTDWDTKNPRSWKKIDGVAQVLDSDNEGRYEFLLMMDAEIAMGNCNAFVQLLPRLREKHKSKKWFGDRCQGASHMADASCAVSALSGGKANEVARLSVSNETFPCKGDPRVMRKLGKETKHFSIYTWWNDVPHVQADSARRMFLSWARQLDAAAHKHQKHKGTFQSIARAASMTWILQQAGDAQEAQEAGSGQHAEAVGPAPSSSEVAGHLGEGPEQLRVAGSAFEHLIYQMYTVVHEGFHVVDLTEAFKIIDGLSMGERYCWMEEDTDKEFYMRTVEPLWQTSGCQLHSSGNPPLMFFHVDRHRLVT